MQTPPKNWHFDKNLTHSKTIWRIVQLTLRSYFIYTINLLWRYGYFYPTNLPQFLFPALKT